MKKNLLLFLLVMSLVFCPLTATGLAAGVADCAGGDSCSHMAAIGNTHYDTLQDAVDAASAGETVTLLSNMELSGTVTVNEGAELTIDLAGFAVTTKERQAGRHYYAIDNYGKLTLTDSDPEKAGSITARGIENLGDGVMTVDGVTITSCDGNGGAAIWNEAELHFNSGVLKTLYVGTSSDSYGPGGLNNQGTAVITGGEFLSVNKRTYAIISTGEIEITPAKGRTVKVAGAHGGLAIDSGSAVVNGGDYSSTDYYGLYVSNDGLGSDPMKAAVTVNGGSFTGPNFSVWIGSDYNNPVNSTIEINDGRFAKPLNAQSCTREGAILISGGLFATDMTKYCAPGKMTVANTDEATKEQYPFTVSDIVINDKIDVDSDLTTGDTFAAVADSIENAKEAMEIAAGVAAAADGENTLAGARTELSEEAAAKDKTEAVAKLEANGIIDVDEKTGALTLKGTEDPAAVTVIYEIYLDVTVTDLSNGDEGKEIAFEIEPKYNLKATVAEDPADMTADNTITLAAGQNMAVDEGKAIDITIPLPQGFAAEGDKVFITHVKSAGRVFKHECTVESGDNGLFVAFTNENGFSSFTVTLPAARIGETNYATLQDAVDAVKDGQTITLLRDNDEEITIGGRSVEFTVDADGKDFDSAKVVAGDDDTTITADASGTAVKFTVVYAPAFDLTIENSAHGKVTAPMASFKVGSTVQLKVSPDYGYALGKLTVTDSNGKQVSVKESDSGYTFTMPMSNVTVKATFILDKSLPAARIGETNYATLQDAVDAVKDGQTITLLRDNDEEITIGGRSVIFTVDADGKEFDPTTIAAGDEYTTIEKAASGTAVRFTAVYAPAFGLTIENIAHGKVTASADSYVVGSTVLLKVEPDYGYVLDRITAADDSGKPVVVTKTSTKYSLTMPMGNVTVKATFTLDKSLLGKFADVKDSDYFATPVLWALANKITDGTSATTFSPDAPCTRAHMVTFLWRTAGCPEPSSKVNKFTDVDADGYYYKALLWATEQGITKGTSDTTFSPDAPCTRAQMVTFLYRMADTPSVSGKHGFTDVPADSYYNDAVTWASVNKITNGMTETTFGPETVCTRGHAVTFLYRAFAD